jgi:hypothetical protein
MFGGIASVPPYFSAGCGRTGTICAIDYAWNVLRSGVSREPLSLVCAYSPKIYVIYCILIVQGNDIL